MYFLRCLKTLALEISVLVLYLISVVLLIISCIKIKWKELYKQNFVFFIVIMVITIAALFTQLALILYKNRENKIFMIKCSIGRAIVVIIVNVVELILLLKNIDRVNYPYRDTNKAYNYFYSINEIKDYNTGIISSAQINLVYGIFIYGAFVGVAEIVISIILLRRYKNFDYPFNPTEDEKNGNDVVITQTKAYNNMNLDQNKQTNPSLPVGNNTATENNFHLQSNDRLNINKK